MNAMESALDYMENLSTIHIRKLSKITNSSEHRKEDSEAEIKTKSSEKGEERASKRSFPPSPPTPTPSGPSEGPSGGEESTSESSTTDGGRTSSLKSSFASTEDALGAPSTTSLVESDSSSNPSLHRSISEKSEIEEESGSKKMMKKEEENLLLSVPRRDDLLYASSDGLFTDGEVEEDEGGEEGGRIGKDKQTIKAEKLIRSDSFRSVKNRKSFKKKKNSTSFSFNSKMSSHERRGVLTNNLSTLTEISTVTHISSELPLPLETERIYQQSRDSDREEEEKEEEEEDEEEEELEEVDESDIKEEDSDIEIDGTGKTKKEKKKTPKKERNLLFKSGKKEEKKSKQGKPLKASKSLIDLWFHPFEGKVKSTTKGPKDESSGRNTVSSMDISHVTDDAKIILEEGEEVGDGEPKFRLNLPSNLDKFPTSMNLPASDIDEENNQNLLSSESDDQTSFYDSSDEIEADALKNLSRSTPAMSPSGSPRQSDSDATTHVSKTNKKFRKKFSKILSSEEVLKSYVCAIVSDILLQGTLYITENYFAFYSNILGFVNRTVIPIVDVSSIQKEKTARFIPNAVGLQTYDGKTYVFSSLISRDATYKFMVHIWKKSKQLSDGVPADDVSFDEDKIESGSNSSCCSHGDLDSVDQGDGAINESSESSQIVTVRSRPPSMVGSSSHLGTKCNSSPDQSHSEGADPNVHVRNQSSSKDKNPPLRGSYTNLSASDWDASKKGAKASPLATTDTSSSSSQESNLRRLIRSKLLNNVIKAGVSPFQAVREGLHEITYLPKTSLLLLSSSFLVFLLLASAAFMIYKVETLSQQINNGSNDEYSSDLYEEVLQMQQKLHSATAEEVEKTLSLQIKQLATVRQSLDALVFLFDKDPSRTAVQMPENS